MLLSAAVAWLEAVRSDAVEFGSVDAAHDLVCHQPRHCWRQSHPGVHDRDVGPGYAGDWPDDW